MGCPLGWRFATAEEHLPGENAMPDPNHKDVSYLRDIYFNVDPNYKGRFTVPTLYDKKTGHIVSNEVRGFPSRVALYIQCW